MFSFYHACLELCTPPSTLLGHQKPPADNPVGPKPGPEEPHRGRRGQCRRGSGPGHSDGAGSGAHAAQTARGADQQLLQHWGRYVARHAGILTEVLLFDTLIILSNRHVHNEMTLTADTGPSGAGVSGTSPAAAAAISAAISANPYLSSTATRVPGQVRFDPRSNEVNVCLELAYHYCYIEKRE